MYLYYPFLHSTTVSHYVLLVHSIQWNAGMGNTNTLHPNCSFSIPSFRIKFLLLVANRATVNYRDTTANVLSVESTHILFGLFMALKGVYSESDLSASLFFC